MNPNADIASIYSSSHSNDSSTSTSTNNLAPTTGEANSIKSISANPPTLPDATNRIQYSSHSFASSLSERVLASDAGSSAASSTAVTYPNTKTHMKNQNIATSAGLNSSSSTQTPYSDDSVSPRDPMFNSSKTLDPVSTFGNSLFSRSVAHSKPFQSAPGTPRSQPSTTQQFLTIHDLQDMNSCSSPSMPSDHSTPGFADDILEHGSPSSFDRLPPSDSRRPSYASQLTNSSIGSGSKRLESVDYGVESSSPKVQYYTDEACPNASIRSNSTAAAPSDSRSINPIVFPQPVSFSIAICYNTNLTIIRMMSLIQKNCIGSQKGKAVLFHTQLNILAICQLIIIPWHQLAQILSMFLLSQKAEVRSHF